MNSPATVMFPAKVAASLPIGFCLLIQPLPSYPASAAIVMVRGQMNFEGTNVAQNNNFVYKEGDLMHSVALFGGSILSIKWEHAFTCIISKITPFLLKRISSTQIYECINFQIEHIFIYSIHRGDFSCIVGCYTQSVPISVCKITLPLMVITLAKKSLASPDGAKRFLLICIRIFY